MSLAGLKRALFRKAKEDDLRRAMRRRWFVAPALLCVSAYSYGLLRLGVYLPPKQVTILRPQVLAAATLIGLMLGPSCIPIARACNARKRCEKAPSAER